MRCSIAGPLYVMTTLLCVPASARTVSDSADVTDIVRKMDELYRASSSAGTMEMEIITPQWSRTLAMQIWSTGMEKTLIRILEPKKERGVATLKIGNEMWNFLPKTDKVIKIPPSMMMSSWMGSDFTNDDLVREYTFIDDYTFRLVRPEDGEVDCYHVECIPKKGRPIIWGRLLTAVRTDNYLPVWEKFYDEKGRLMRIIRFKDIKTFGSRTIPSVMELEPQNRLGHRTVVRYVDFEFDCGVDEETFSLRTLRAPVRE